MSGYAAPRLPVSRAVRARDALLGMIERKLKRFGAADKILLLDLLGEELSKRRYALRQERQKDTVMSDQG